MMLFISVWSFCVIWLRNDADLGGGKWLGLLHLLNSEIMKDIEVGADGKNMVLSFD